MSVIEPKTVKRPGPPAGMTKRARGRWIQTVKDYAVDHFKAGDLPLLRAYCEAEALHFLACEKCDGEAAVIVIETQNGPVPRENPWFKIMEKTAATLASLGCKLRIVANSRITAKAAAKERPEEKQSSWKMFGV
jgi:phage terminase small subunit